MGVGAGAGVMRRWAPVVVVLVVLVGALTAGAVRDSKGPTVASRVTRIADEVRCPTCEGLSANESDAPSSLAIREQIRSQVEQGYSDDEVRVYLVDRYGKDILLRPSGTGVSSLVWALPVAGGVAAAAGLVLVFRRWRRRASQGGAASEFDVSLVAAAVPGPEHSEEVNFLLTSLADLERERAAGDIDEADYLSLRDDYTTRAASALFSTAPAAVENRVSWARRVAVAVGIVVVAAGAGMAVARTAGERLPGQEVAGGITETGPGEKLSRAAALAGQGDILEAIKLYDEVIKDDPENAVALAYRGWLVRLTGKSAKNQELIDKGLGYIDRAIAADPSFPDAHFFRGEILLRDKNDPAGAIPEFRAFLDGGGDPGMAELVRSELAAAEQAAATNP